MTAYALGTDVIKMEQATPTTILNAPRQSGFNLFQGAEVVYSSDFSNPTYVFFLLDGSAAITDLGSERTTLQKVLEHNNVVTAFIETGKQTDPHTIKRISAFSITVLTSFQ